MHYLLEPLPDALLPPPPAAFLLPFRGMSAEFELEEWWHRGAGVGTARRRRRGVRRRVRVRVLVRCPVLLLVPVPVLNVRERPLCVPLSPDVTLPYALMAAPVLSPWVRLTSPLNAVPVVWAVLLDGPVLADVPMVPLNVLWYPSSVLANGPVPMSWLIPLVSAWACPAVPLVPAESCLDLSTDRLVCPDWTSPLPDVMRLCSALMLPLLMLVPLVPLIAPPVPLPYVVSRSTDVRMCLQVAPLPMVAEREFVRVRTTSSMTVVFVTTRLCPI